MTKQVGRGRATVAALGAVALLLGACGGSDDDADSGSDDPTESATTAEEPCGDGSSAPECTPPTDGGQPADLSAFHDQSINWSSCGSYECGTVEVPLDYADPSGDTVQIKMKRAPATSSGERLGTLFINPGGPGGSGQDYVETFIGRIDDDLRSRYDIIGFDPRGVGESDPLVCLNDEELDELIESDPDPDNPAEVKEARQLMRDFGRACANAGELAGHVSTVEVAKDLDILRAVVGDQKLSYYGASYGTAIGATYAELYPKRVGRMVLDAALDPSLSAQQQNIQQAAGFQTALEAYVDDCLTSSSCPLGPDRAGALDQISDLLEDLDQNPLDTGNPDRPLTEALGFYGIALPLYSRDSWPLLTQALEAAMDGDGSMLLRFADVYLSRTPSGYSDNSAQVIYAVNCLDDPVSLSNREIRRSEARYEQASPVFGRIFAWSMLSCSEWPVQPVQPAPKIDAAGAAPIVVVGTTRDPATPYRWAKALANQLESGVLVSRDGDGHGGYGQGNSCVDDAVDGYLVGGDVPRDGLSC